jgi:hypothetical protein
MRKKIIIPVLSLSLCGCAAIKSGGVYQEDTRQSLAMNVASAAGITGKPKEGLHDYPKKDWLEQKDAEPDAAQMADDNTAHAKSKPLKLSGPLDVAAAVAVAGAGVAVAVMSPVPGLGIAAPLVTNLGVVKVNGTGGPGHGMITSAMASDPPGENYPVPSSISYFIKPGLNGTKVPHLVVWPDAAQEGGKGEAIARDVERAVVTASGLNGLAPAIDWVKPLLGSRDETRILALPGCPSHESEKSLWHDRDCSGSVVVGILERQPTGKPSFLGGATEGRPVEVGFEATGALKPRGGRDEIREWWKRFSKALPANYFYFDPKSRKMPFVLNKGEVLWFVER